jgi:3-hydroxyisobutyrate dehydrogenase-like beta-hydroxyacid dehydrogenase
MSVDPQRVTVVGLGLMGNAIAARLIEHGYSVSVWSRIADEAATLLALGAHWTDDPFGISNRVILSLYSSEVVSDVLNRFASSLRAGQIIADTTTGSPEDALAMSKRLAEQGIQYLDAPISGSSQQTRRGEAMVMVAGDRATFDACRDLWQVLGAKVVYVGASGSAAKMKLVTNLVLGLNRVALAEGLSYARAIGVDANAALQVLIDSAAYSKAMDVKGRKMIDQDFAPQARLSQHLKDVRLIIESALNAGLPLPMSNCHRQLLEQAEQTGWGDLDNSAIIQVYDIANPREQDHNR